MITLCTSNIFNLYNLKYNSIRKHQGLLINKHEQCAFQTKREIHRFEEKNQQFRQTLN